eukprot:CAMPEP_0184661930 /NCGR_PEP_ID=MMETSP0308-20130426/40849_1 /TAXON_ID=38269 /ORGANISM="Gloeochaete witrockiana, Strain SAG 46.84" /LENGTH=210 /DNA_ID=CAMNT_0027103599 /DNA_START=237 /DNA_END=869 /DNA_ORIENTATION=-
MIRPQSSEGQKPLKVATQELDEKMWGLVGSLVGSRGSNASSGAPTPSTSVKGDMSFANLVGGASSQTGPQGSLSMDAMKSTLGTGTGTGTQGSLSMDAMKREMDARSGAASRTTGPSSLSGLSAFTSSALPVSIPNPAIPLTNPSSSSSTSSSAFPLHNQILSATMPPPPPVQHPHPHPHSHPISSVHQHTVPVSTLSSMIPIPSNPPDR